MNVHTVAGEVEARWALFGKTPGDRKEYRVLACGEGSERCLDYEAPVRAGVSIAVREGAQGTPAAPPQVSFVPWADQGISYCCVTVIEPSNHLDRDRDGRPITEASFFAIPAAWALARGTSFAALYDAVRDVRLAPEHAGPVVLDIAESELAPIADFLRDDAEMGAWLIRMAGAVLARSVVVTGPPLQFDKRLAALDAVGALLPAWARCRIAVTTWADKPRPTFALAFGETADRKQIKVPWRAAPAQNAPPDAYAVALDELCQSNYGTHAVLAHLHSLRSLPPDDGKDGNFELAVWELDALRRLVTFDVTSPVDPARLGEVAALGREIPVDRWPGQVTRRIQALAIEGADAGLPEAADALSSVWSSSAGDQAVHASTTHLAYGRIKPVWLMLVAAWEAGEAAAFLMPLVQATEAVDDLGSAPSLAAAPRGQESLVEVLTIAAQKPGLIAAISPALTGADRLNRRVVTAVAREQPDAVAALVAALLTGPEGPGAFPPWLGLLGPWLEVPSSPAASAGHRKASSPEGAAWRETMIAGLDLDAIPTIWAVAHALHIPQLVDWTYGRLIEVFLHRPGKTSLSELPGWPAYGWALTERFGQNLTPRMRARADVARIVVGLAPADVPGPGEPEMHVREYVDECLRVCRSEIFTADERPWLRHRLSNSLLAHESTGLSNAAARLLDLLATSPDEDDRQYLAVQLLKEHAKSPGWAMWLRGKPRQFFRSLIGLLPDTEEAAAAKQLKLTVRALEVADTVSPKSLDSLAEVAADEGFGHNTKANSAQVVLRELKEWPGCHNPGTVDDFLGRWQAALRRHGLNEPEALRKARDARSEILSGIWGVKFAHQYGDYCMAAITLHKEVRTREIEEAKAQIQRIGAEIEVRRTEMASLQAQADLVRARIQQLLTDIEGDDRFINELAHLFPTNRSH